MGSQEQARSAKVDAWLASGGVVLAANERAARAVSGTFHAARRAEGLTAWQTPAVFAWESWVRERWREHNDAGLILLSPLQEQQLWAQVIRASTEGHADAPSLDDLDRDPGRDPGRLAAAAQQAYRLLATYSPASLKASSRSGWTGDSSIFSEWMAEFDLRCRREGLMPAARAALHLTESLQTQPHVEFSQDRPKLLLIGFDRLLEAQRRLLEAWGDWEPYSAAAQTDAAKPARFFAIPEQSTELAACVSWLRRRLKANPEARLMVVTTGLKERRGELERALLAGTSEETLDFEFSLGVPLGQVGLARSALLLLRWLYKPLLEPEVDWLLTCGFCASSGAEEIALVEWMRELRRRGLERPEWPLESFLLPLGVQAAEAPETTWAMRKPLIVPPDWTARLNVAREILRNTAPRKSPLEWTQLTGQLLDALGWPGSRPLSSGLFQARKRWEKVLEDCAALGYDGSQMTWAAFVPALAAAVSGTIFATESTDAPVQITEPLESAGQLADGIWFLGAHEENWPGRGQPNPLLPIGLQREAGMPHASPQADWDLAREATLRLASSADEVIFSYALDGAGEAEARPSRLVTQLPVIRSIAQPGAEPHALPEEFAAEVMLANRKPLTESFEDHSRIAFPHPSIAGGAATLTRQSQCPFLAFATVRLGADTWEPAEAGLNARQRGQLLHAVLHRVWGGSLRSLEALRQISDLTIYVRSIVEQVTDEQVMDGLEMLGQVMDARRNAGMRDFLLRFPPRLLELEAMRLTRLVAEWLGYERRRHPFNVVGTEVSSQITIAGATLQLRLDRVDELADGTQLVIDYKSSVVGPRAWEGDRPDDVQLPLYATLAVGDYEQAGENMGGLVFGRVRPGDVKFMGLVRDAVTTLIPGLHSSNGLVKNPLNDRHLEDWRRRIEQLGADFLAGKADVDPKDPAKTCRTCHLHAVCRIHESQPVAAALAEQDEDQENDHEGEQRGNGGGDAEA